MMGGPTGQGGRARVDGKVGVARWGHEGGRHCRRQARSGRATGPAYHASVCRNRRSWSVSQAVSRMNRMSTVHKTAMVTRNLRNSGLGTSRASRTIKQRQCATPHASLKVSPVLSFATVTGTRGEHNAIANVNSQCARNKQLRRGLGEQLASSQKHLSTYVSAASRREMNHQTSPSPPLLALSVEGVRHGQSAGRLQGWTC